MTNPTLFNQFRFFLFFFLLTISISLFSQTYSTVVSGQTFTTAMLYSNTNGLLIDNCIFKNINAWEALKITSCSNVMIRNCTFQDITCPGDGGKVLLICLKIN